MEICFDNVDKINKKLDNAGKKVGDILRDLEKEWKPDLTMSLENGLLKK